MSPALTPHDPFRALLWDLDGTIIDSRRDLAAAVNLLLADLGHGELPLDQIVAHIGRGARNLVARSLADASHEVKSEDELNHLLALFARHYDHGLLDTTRPYRGMRKLLYRLRDRGRMMAVVTNKPEGMTWRILDGLKLNSCFQAIVGDAPGRPRKPEPGPVELALDLMGRAGDPDRAMMIGDSRVDLEASRAARVPCCGVSWGFGDVSDMRMAGPEWWAESVGDLARLLFGKVRVSSAS